MAIVTFGALVAGVRASIGDTTFATWKGRAYVRTRTIPANPNTATQQLYRNCMAAAVKLWQAIHAEVVDYWKTYATPYQVSGYNAMISDCATKPTRMRIVDTPIIQIVPADPAALPITVFNAVPGLAAKGITVTWDSGVWGGPDTGVIVAFKETGNTYYDTPDTVKDLVADGIDMIAGTYELTVGEANKAYTIVMSALESSTGRYSTAVQKKNVTSHA